MVIQPGEIKLLAERSWNHTIEPREQSVDRVALRGGSRRHQGCPAAARNTAQVPCLRRAVDRRGAEAADHREVAPRHLGAQEEEQLVLLDRAAEGCTGLVALLRSH